MAIRKSYVNAELRWAERQLKQWKKYVEDNPVQELQDRIVYRETTAGSSPQVVASIETQGKFIQETMKNYLALLAEVDRLREAEEAKKQARGTTKVPHRMK